MADIEEELYGGGTAAERTKRIFDAASPRAALQIIDISNNGANDAVKLRASQYIVDRILGPVGKDDQQDALDAFLSGIEAIANGGQSK